MPWGALEANAEIGLEPISDSSSTSAIPPEKVSDLSFRDCANVKTCLPHSSAKQGSASAIDTQDPKKDKTILKTRCT